MYILNSKGQIGSASKYSPLNGSETRLLLNVIAALQKQSPIKSGALK
jgi:hypothetical protein